MSKEKLIPLLRFPVFKNEGEWDNKSLIETSDKTVKWSFTGGPFGSNLKGSDYKSAGIRIIQLQNIGDGEFNDGYKIYTSEEKADELLSCNIYAGEIILSKMGDPVGRACIIPDFLKRSVMASDGIRLVVNENKYSKYFIYSLINSKHIRGVIEKKATGSTRKRIGLDELKEVPLTIPKSLQEQQKIASCLSSLDEVIAAHSQKLELLKDHKKGLMQNLFPDPSASSGGEKVPKYRFKEFEKDGEWVEKKLGDVIEIKGRIGYRGYTLADIVNKGEGAISMSPSNINEFGTLSFTKSTYITWAKYEESPEIMLQNEYTLLVKTGSTYGKVAFIKNLQEKTTINPQLVVLKPKKINSYFLYLLVANAAVQKQINATVVGGAIPTLSQESISNFEILVPKTKEEEERIADFLSSLNELIISQTEKIEQLQEHKKGLMQGLFPKIND